MAGIRHAPGPTRRAMAQPPVLPYCDGWWRWSSPEPPFPRADDSYRVSVGVISVSRGGAMERVFLVGLGGFIGTVFRYALGGWVRRLEPGADFPWGTLLVNVLGCLAIGLIGALSETRGAPTGTTRAFLFIGVLGGFTTFSAFGYETFQLMRYGQAGGAALNVGLQVAIGIGAVWGGHALARLLWAPGGI